jgi:antitoxin (DNA-binding transcriptional repressor) of toxin-antitoxin stability system
VKTINEQQAAQKFDEYSERVHNGERILVTRDGKPWVMLLPPPAQLMTEPVELEWPDFAARLASHYSMPSVGPTATELLAQDKEDRF